MDGNAWELGQMKWKHSPGKIFIALNDGQQTVAAGNSNRCEHTVPCPSRATPPPTQNPNARLCQASPKCGSHTSGAALWCAVVGAE